MTENAKPVRAAGDVASRWLSRAAILLVGVAAVLGWGASFVGLHAYGMQSMSGFTYWSAWLVPGTFDGAAFACTLLTYRSSINGRSSMRGRLLMWAFTGVSSWINWIHQPSHQAQIVAAGLPIAAVAVFDIVLIELRADFEARHGRRGFRLRPGLLVLRWIVDRSSTRDAFRRQVIDIPVEEIAGLGPLPTRADAATSSGLGTDIDGMPRETASGTARPDERSTADHADRSNRRTPALAATVSVPATVHPATTNGGSRNGGTSPTRNGGTSAHNGVPESTAGEVDKPQLGTGHTTRTADDRDRSGPETIRLPYSTVAEAGATVARMSSPARRTDTKATTATARRPQTDPSTAERQPTANTASSPDSSSRAGNAADPDDKSRQQDRPRPDDVARTDETPAPTKTSQSANAQQRPIQSQPNAKPQSSARTPAKATPATQTTEQSKSQTTVRLRAPGRPDAATSTANSPQPPGPSPTRTTTRSQSATPATRPRQPTSPADKRAAARQDYLTALRANRPITGAELGARYGLSASWGQKQIAAARQEHEHATRG